MKYLSGYWGSGVARRYKCRTDDLEDIQYHIYVRQKVQKGLEAAREGRTLTHAEVVRRMARWLEK